MVAKSADFVPYLLNGQHSLTPVLGSDVMGGPKNSYNVNLTTLCLVAMVMKAVQDIAPTVATDAFWTTRLNAAVDMTGGWPGWILAQVAPEDLAQYGATLTDTVEQVQAKIAAFNAGQ